MVYCENCGNQLSELATACPKCGHPQGAARAATERPRMEGTAIVSLILGIFGVISCPVILSIPAVVVGNQARQKIRSDPSLDGDALAKAGVILGWIGIGIAALALLGFIVAFAVGVSGPSFDV